MDKLMIFTMTYKPDLKKRNSLWKRLYLKKAMI